MILLDTNVLSALMQVAPDQTVAKWMDRQPGNSIWTSCITVMEVRAGLLAMPAGRRREALFRAFARLVEERLQGRVASFDIAAAEQSAELMAQRKLRGQPRDWRDTMIAGIAQASRATFATRNTAYFEDLSVPVVNPWTA
jgi:predicted nucleic acid-binding protein